MKTSLPLLLGLALAGCYTELPVEPAAEEAPPAAFASLQKGQPAAQVRALLGAPAEIKPFKPGILASEIWVYHRKVWQTDQQVPVGSREVPQTNLVTGQTGLISEPVYETQTTTVVETVELLMVEQRLIEWKTRRQTEHQVHFR